MEFKRQRLFDGVHLVKKSFKHPKSALSKPAKLVAELPVLLARCPEKSAFFWFPKIPMRQFGYYFLFFSFCGFPFATNQLTQLYPPLPNSHDRTSHKSANADALLLVLIGDILHGLAVPAAHSLPRPTPPPSPPPIIIIIIHHSCCRRRLGQAKLLWSSSLSRLPTGELLCIDP